MVCKRYCWFGSAACWLMVGASWLALAEPAPRPQVRRPVAAVFLGGGRTLCVANQRSGSLSLVNVAEAKVRGETAVGQRLSGLAVLPDRRHVLVTDDQQHELIVVAFDGTGFSIRARTPVSPYPVSVAIAPDGKRASIACLWSRRLDVVDLTPLSSAGSISLRVVHSIRLPFAPRLQCALPGQAQLLVADSFAGHFAVVDTNGGQIVAVHALDAHNLRGLALTADGKQVLLAHQVMDQTAPTTREHVERGILMANVLRVLPLDAVLTPGADLERVGRLIRLDAADLGAGDPAGITIIDAEQVAVALAGVNELALVRADGKAMHRLAVGRRPTTLLAGHHTLVCVNTFDDSLSFVDLREGRVARSLSLGPSAELSPQDRGELLFHDARLSLQGRLSCHSCHTDGHTSGLRADTLGDKTYGTPKRILTLMNTALTDPWAWNGEMKDLHDQVRQSLRETMHGFAATAAQVNDLVSFLHTLPPPPPLEPVTAADRAQVERGRRLFQERGCVHCHIPPLTYSSSQAYDVGFADERGLSLFNPPSLRGVSQGYRFLHDNRAATLEEVFTRYRHKVRADMPAEDRADLLRFLRSL